MHQKFLAFLFWGAALLLGACSPLIITGSSGSQPTPVEASVPAQNPDNQAVMVENVSVEIGRGSPIPVNIFVSGTWPGPCSQVSLLEQRFEGSRIEVELWASTAQGDCPSGQPGLPFRFPIPLNIVEMPAGTYTVAVNGVETQFDWRQAGEAPDLAGRVSGEPQPLRVENVQVQVGTGSPIPVDVFITNAWPGLCSQLVRIEQHVEGTLFDITLHASPDSPQCSRDYVGLRLPVTLPLNMVEMQPGVYTVRVNGVETVFNWPQAPGEQGEGEASLPVNLAFIGGDGNVWVLEAGDHPRAITQDAVSMGQQNPNPPVVIQYSSPRLSTDGRLLAFRRDAGQVHQEGIDYVFEFWVIDLETGESRRVLDSAPAGFAWKPGTHLLAYSPGVQDGYFAWRGEVDPGLAQGIWQVNLDQESYQPEEIVPPQRGYSLVSPVWSPDGRFLSFEEVHLYEGRGLFAYYDLENREYVPWDETIGSYDWSPDGGMIAYDRMVYIPTAEERIYLRERKGGQEYLLSKEIGANQGYAFHPVFSPQGDRIAYLFGSPDPDSQMYTLAVQSTTGGEMQALGEFESVQGLNWTAAGENLIFSAGPYQAPQVIQVNISDGTARALVPGGVPALPAK